MRLTLYWLGTLLVVTTTHAQLQFSKFGPQQRGQFAVPDGYLPPPPDSGSCVPMVKFSTYTGTKTSVVTSYFDAPASKLSTVLRRETEIVLTTQFQISTRTQFFTATQLTTSENFKAVTSTYATTIAGIPVTRTVSTVIPSTLKVTSTVVSTRVSSTLFTRTIIEEQVVSKVNPVTRTKTDQIVLTDYVRLPGQDITKSTIQTTTRTRTIQTTPPGKTITVTKTSTSVALTTTALKPPPIIVTKTTQTTQVVGATRTSTLNRETVQTSKYTSTILDYRTEIDTIYQTVTATSQRVDTRTSTVQTTVISTRATVTTRYETQDDIKTLTQPPVYQTTTIVKTVTGTLPIIQTVTSSITVTERKETTGTKKRELVTVTKTVNPNNCGRTGYKYDRPAVKFNF